MLLAETTTSQVRTARPGEEARLSQLVIREALRTYASGDPGAVQAWAARTYSAAAIRRRIDADHCLVLVCTDPGERLLGMCCAELQPGPLHTDALLGGTYLVPKARGRGLMAPVYCRVLEWLQERRAQSVLAYVHAENARGRSLLSVVGFTHRADVPGALVPGMVWSLMTAEVPPR